jgi:hypothetical protein
VFAETDDTEPGRAVGFRTEIRPRRCSKRTGSFDAMPRRSEHRLFPRHPSFGTFVRKAAYQEQIAWRSTIMDGIIYLVGLIVIILAILSFFGLR